MKVLGQKQIYRVKEWDPRNSEIGRRYVLIFMLLGSIHNHLDT